MNDKRLYDVTVVLVIEAATSQEAIECAEAVIAYGVDFNDSGMRVDTTWVEHVQLAPQKEIA